MKKYYKLILMVCFIFILTNTIFILPAQADFPTLIPAECLGDADVKECNLSSVEKMLGNAAQIILGIAGSLTLLMFIYGGVLFLFAGGAPKNIQKGINVIKLTVIGLAIILLAGVFIKILLRVLSGYSG